MRRTHPPDGAARKRAQALVDAIRMTAASDARAIAWGLLSELDELREAMPEPEPEPEPEDGQASAAVTMPSKRRSRR
jgi:hypothetical protein